MNLLFEGQILENLSSKNSYYKSRSATAVMIFNEHNQMKRCFYVFEKIYTDIEKIQPQKSFLKILDFIYKVWDLQTNERIFHGDLKRENIMIDKDQIDIKIIDLDISIYLDKAKKNFSIKGYTPKKSTHEH